jgi:membrane protease YdiL (CAAX protease family)
VWKDILGRLVPFAIASAVYARLSDEGPRAIGLTREGLGREMALGVALGVPMLGTAIVFRAWDAPRYRLPTAADQALQTAFYLGLNAPIEEMFWRGTVQNVTIRALRRFAPLHKAAVPLGWAFTTACFGAYHRLGRWRWRTIAGVTAAGGAFGALFLRSRRRSLAATIVVHGFATAGFLSWGDVALHALQNMPPQRSSRGT